MSVVRLKYMSHEDILFIAQSDRFKVEHVEIVIL